MLGITLWRVDSGKGEDRTLKLKAPVERAIDSPLADGANLLRHYALSDDDIKHPRERGITGWLSRSIFAPFVTFQVGTHPANRRIPAAKASIAALAYDSALYWSRLQVALESRLGKGPEYRHELEAVAGETGRRYSDYARVRDGRAYLTTCAKNAGPTVAGAEARLHVPGTDGFCGSCIGGVGRLTHPQSAICNRRFWRLLRFSPGISARYG